MKTPKKIFGKVPVFRGTRPVYKHSSFATIAIGAAFWTGYLVYLGLKKKK